MQSLVKEGVSVVSLMSNVSLVQTLTLNSKLRIVSQIGLVIR